MYAAVQAGCALDAPVREGMRGAEAAFWQAAAYACVALRDGDDDAWSRAVGAWTSEGGSGFAGTGCQVDRVRGTVRSIMGPAPSAGRRPVAVLRGPAPGLACRPAGMGLTPSHGPAGTRVTLRWTGSPWMHYSGRVRFDSRPANLAQDGPSEATLIAPEHDVGPSRVVLELDNGQVLDFGSFTYE